jgi:hypothetical protein
MDKIPKNHHSPELALDFDVMRNEIVVGEELGVTGTLRNIGSHDAQLSHSVFQSRYSYELRRVSDGQLVQTISQAIYRSWTAPDRVQNSPAEMISLGPGESLPFNEEIGSLAISPIAAGEYHLICHYASPFVHVVSPPAMLKVVPPRLNAFASSYCSVETSFCAIYAHREDDTQVLLQLDTELGDPNDGAFLRRLTREGPAISCLALAVATEWPAEGRWFSWIQGSTFRAARGWGNALTGHAEPIELGTSTLELLPEGIQTADGYATFVAIDRAGHRMIRCRCEGKRIESASYRAPWISHPQKIALSFYGAPGAETTHVLWSEQTTTGIEIMSAPFPPDGGEFSKPQLLSSQEAPFALVDWSVPAVHDEDEPALVLLWEPAGADNLLVYQRVELVSAKRSTNAVSADSLVFLPPTEPVLQWAISVSPGSFTPVIARTPSAILWTDAAAEDGWLELTRVDKASELRLFVAEDGRHWARWMEEDRGLCFLLLPKMSAIVRSDDSEETDDVRFDDNDEF